MDDTTKQFLKLMREEQNKDHQEVKRRLDVIEQNQRDFQNQIALKSDVETLHERVSDAKTEIEGKLEVEKTRTAVLEKKNAELEGGLKATKFWGSVVGGLLILAEVILSIFKFK